MVSKTITPDCGGTGISDAIFFVVVSPTNYTCHYVLAVGDYKDTGVTVDVIRSPEIS